MADIFDEVTEELRQDQLKQFWYKYQRFIFGIIFIILLTVGSYQGYIFFKNKKIQENSNLFINALSELEKKNFSEAEKSLLKLNSENQSGYFMLSLFALADISLKKGNFQLMEKYYKSIIENKNFDKFYRDLALINLTINSKKMDKNIKLKELQPILTSPSKLQSYAAELEILYLFDVGKVNLAKDKLDKLLKRPDVKNNQKNRLSIIKRVFLN